MKSTSGKKHPGGRPPKFKSIEELQTRIDKYFASCWTQKRDKFGNPIYEKDKRGRKTNKKVLVQSIPYTIAGLATTLDMTRQSILNYERQDEFFDTIKRAKQRCEAYAEESLFIGKNPVGAIFNLKNNYGWRDKFENEHSGNVTWIETPPK